MKLTTRQLHQIIREEVQKSLKEEDRIVCPGCGHQWDLSDGGNDPYTCHMCGQRATLMEDAKDVGMVNGVADILTKVKDEKNRKEIAQQIMGKFDLEDVDYDKESFLKLSKVSENIITNLDKKKNDLIKKVNTLIAKKKKLYSNIDITTPKSAEEKSLDKDIADIFSQINTLVLQKRKLTKTSKSKKISEAYSKGQLFAGNLKIDGQKVPVEVELLGADDKTKTFIAKVIHIDKKYYSKLPKDGVLNIPARIFRVPGGGWRRIKTPSVF